MLWSQPILGGTGGEGRGTRILCQEEPGARRPRLQEAPTDATPSQGKGTFLREYSARGLVSMGQRRGAAPPPSFSQSRACCVPGTCQHSLSLSPSSLMDTFKLSLSGGVKGRGNVGHVDWIFFHLSLLEEMDQNRDLFSFHCEI